MEPSQKPMPEKEPDPHQSRVLIDMDGVITVGQGNGKFDFAPLTPGIAEFLEELHSMFDEVVVCSSRSDHDAIKEVLRKNGLIKYVSKVTSEKLPAKLIIEDRAVLHEGDLKKTLRKVKSFEPHWEKDGVSKVGHEKDEKPGDEKKDDKPEKKDPAPPPFGKNKKAAGESQPPEKP